MGPKAGFIPSLCNYFGSSLLKNKYCGLKRKTSPQVLEARNKKKRKNNHVVLVLGDLI